MSDSLVDGARYLFAVVARSTRQIGLLLEYIKRTERFRGEGCTTLIPETETFEVATNQAMIAIAPPPIATWTARYGRVVASDAHAFGRLEITRDVSAYTKAALFQPNTTTPLS